MNETKENPNVSDLKSLDLKYVDICCGLTWGDEGKGKVISHLSKNSNYEFVCRWAGGDNAGHTIYINGNKYETHIVPSGIFYNVKSIIGPDCVVNIDGFFKEIEYLKGHGFDTTLIKISPLAHVVQEKHLEEDNLKYFNKLGTTKRGIAPCYRDKCGRTGKQVKDFDIFNDYIWDGILYGNILCEGAQGFWLDINYGNYPYNTSSVTLPYGACSLGFSPKKIRYIYGAAKIYDTRSGFDPDFPKELLDDPDLAKIGELGKEYGVTTGRRRIVNWLNLDKLVSAINISGTTNIIISKIDILEMTNVYKLYYNNELVTFANINNMRDYINNVLKQKCKMLDDIRYSNNPESI